MKFHLLGDGTKIAIEIIDRKYLDASDFWDGNWINSKINIEIPGYLARFNANLRTDELMTFLNQLKRMDNQMKGKAILENIEDFISLKGEMNGLGNITWTGETCYPLGTGAILNFEFESDQSFLRNLTKELEEILDRFPVIGKP